MQPLHHCKHLLDQLNKQREAGFLCDCTVVIGQSQFQAHRNVLAAFSEYFSTQCGDPAGNSVMLLDPETVDAAWFEKLLKYMYTGDIEFESCNVREVHKAATFLKMEALAALCDLTLGYLTTDAKPVFTESASAAGEHETGEHETGEHSVALTGDEFSDADDALMDSSPESPGSVLSAAESTEVHTQGPEKMGKKARKPRNSADGDSQPKSHQKEKRQQKAGVQPQQGEAFSDASNKTAEAAGQGIQSREGPDGESLLSVDNGTPADQSPAAPKLSLKRGKTRKHCTLKENCATDPASEENSDIPEGAEMEDLSDKQLKTKPACSTCGKVFSEASSLRRHMRIHKGVKPYVCQLCGKAFTQCNQLKTHVRTHTGEKPYQCDLCEKGFAQKCQLVFHSRMHHGEEKPYKCDICGLQFATSSNLKIHARKHSGEKPYVCDRCGQRFAQASTLTYHVRRHTGEKPYICDTCGKAFAVSSSLITHARKHTGEKPYMCRTCGKSFISSGELNKHCRSHTGEKPFVCELCGNSYTDVKNLKKHKAKAHSVDRGLDPSSSTFEEGHVQQKASLQDTVELKPADVPLSLTLPIAPEEQQMLLSGTDSSSVPPDQLLRPMVTGYSEPQYIFLQQLY
uniref:Myoneurin n=1 Tax=Lepisosteus oculatus TaxID=7918 RepID=W5MJR2_LEPOC|nr:PREDICTED: myoneurin [Lepisosteus oculatus]XP_015216820.1 PREDICTED: myoneurin [Lepisosteus oculatus]